MTTTDFTLYCFAQSGNAYKAALMLNLCGASWTPRFVDFFNGETRTPEYREKINEMGEVPVLEHKGKRLSQSGVILHYLAAHFGKFTSNDETEKQEILRWILWDNHKLTSYIATKFWTSIWAPRISWRGANPPSPTSRYAATCTGPTNSAYRGRTIRASGRGSSASVASRAGCIRMS